MNEKHRGVITIMEKIINISLSRFLILWYEANKTNNTAAQFELGKRYYNGKGDVVVNRQKATEWYKKSSKSGNAEASLELGKCYELGFGIRKDYKQAINWYKCAEQQTINHLMNTPPLFNYDFNNIEKHYVEQREHFNYYKETAEQGDAVAQYKLGNHYKRGIGLEKDWGEAFYWFRESAEQDNILAQYELGNCYYYGWGVKQNLEEAVKWFRKAAEQGFEDSQEKLSDCYYYGKGVIMSYKESAKWLRKATEQKVKWCDWQGIINNSLVYVQYRGDFNWKIIAIRQKIN